MKENSGCEKKVVKVEKNCGKTAVYAVSEDTCKCLDATQIFNPTTVKCYTIKQWLEKNDCGTGQFKDIATSQCQPCRSKDSNNLCTACTGG